MKLNQKERSFAEDNHNLIYAFLHRYRLPQTEYYDILAIAYLKAVKEYNEKPELRQKYAFSTIAYKKMWSAKVKQYHTERVRELHTAFSLNDFTTKGKEYIEKQADQQDAFRKFEMQQEVEKFLEDIMPALTERQRRQLIGRIREIKIGELIKESGLSNSAFYKDFTTIKGVAAAVLQRES